METTPIGVIVTPDTLIVNSASPSVMLAGSSVPVSPNGTSIARNVVAVFAGSVTSTTVATNGANSGIGLFAASVNCAESPMNVIETAAPAGSVPLKK